MTGIMKVIDYQIPMTMTNTDNTTSKFECKGKVYFSDDQDIKETVAEQIGCDQCFLLGKYGFETWQSITNALTDIIYERINQMTFIPQSLS